MDNPMSHDKILEFLGRGKEQYQRLLEEAVMLLRNFDTYGPVDFDKAIIRRQKLISEIQRLDIHCSRELDRLEGTIDGDVEQSLGEFKRFQETTIREILELDSLVIALATGRLDSLRGNLATLARGKTAVSAYDKSELELRRGVNEAC